MVLSDAAVGEIQIIISTILFGATYVGMRYAMVDNLIGPLTFNALRHGCSLIWIVICSPWLKDYADKAAQDALSRHYSVQVHENHHIHVLHCQDNVSELPEVQFSELLYWALLSGSFTFGGSLFEQIGMATVTAAKAGFISGSYVVIIPFIEWLLPTMRGQPFRCLSLRTWLGAGLCFLGLYLISGCSDVDSSCLDSSSVHGEGLIMIAVLFWTGSIMAADSSSKRVNSLHLSMSEFGVVTIISLILALVFEPQYWVFPFLSIRKYALLLVAVGFSEGGGFLLAQLGQAHVSPSRSSILYSVGDALATCLLGYMLLGETLSNMELVGGCVMVAATLLSSESLENLDKEGEERSLIVHHELELGGFRYNSISNTSTAL